MPEDKNLNEKGAAEELANTPQEQPVEYTDDNMSEGAIVSFHRVSNCDKFKNGEITFQINQWCNLSYSKKLDTYVLKGDSPVT